MRRVQNPLVVFNNLAVRRIISLRRADGMLDRTFNAKSAVDFVERARNKDNARVADRPKKRKLCGGKGTERRNGLHPSCGPIAGLAALISCFIVPLRGR